MIKKLVKIFTPQKLKKYMLAIPDTFPVWHSRALENTHFASLIKTESGSPQRKIHAIRTNYNFWEKASRKINAGETSLRVCYMVDGIEKMTYHPIAVLSKIGIQELLITTDDEAFVDGKSIEIHKCPNNYLNPLFYNCNLLVYSYLLLTIPEKVARVFFHPK